MQDDIPTLRRILARDRTIAVVGLSAEWHRPSYFAAKYMQEHGYRIVPVNPRYPEILGEKSYARLEDIPFPGRHGGRVPQGRRDPRHRATARSPSAPRRCGSSWA